MLLRDHGRRPYRHQHHSSMDLVELGNHLRRVKAKFSDKNGQTLWPTVWSTISTEKSVFLFNTEPWVFVLDEVHGLLGVVTVVGLVWSAIAVVAFCNYLIRVSLYFRKLCTHTKMLSPPRKGSLKKAAGRK